MHCSWGQVYYTSPDTVSCHGFPNCLSVLMSSEGGYTKNHERLRENETKHQRILRNFCHRLAVVCLKVHSITDMQIQMENCKNLFIGYLKWWQHWYLHAVFFYLVHIIFLFFRSFLFCFFFCSVLSLFNNIPVFGVFSLSQILYFVLSFSSFQSISIFNFLWILPSRLLSSLFFLFLSISPFQFPIILKSEF